MSYKTLLCIGGPKAGQLIDIRNGVACVEFPVLPDFSGPIDECSSQPGDTFDVILYRRVTLTDIDGAPYEALVTYGTSAIRELLVNYKPKHDRAGKA